MIYDAFMFCAELDVLELRIHTLGPVVDRFVLVEGSQTFQGQPKPMVYKEHASRFKPILEQYGCELIHVPVTVFPMTDNPWEIEYFQRNAILRGLKDALPDDLILVSDVDEIPNPGMVLAVAGAHESRLLPADAVVCCEQVLYAYTLNWRHTRPWYGTRMLRRSAIDFLQELRSTVMPRPGEKVLKGAGWSFSSFGGAQAVREKLQAFAHSECNTPEHTDPAHIERCIQEGRGILPTDNFDMVWAEVDDTYPPYLVAHPEQFEHWLADKAIAERWAV